MKGGLFTIGNPLLDITANVGDDFLTKYGLESNNAILAEDKHLPLYEDLKANFEVSYTAGGAGMNSIRVAQWMIDAEGTSTYFGAVGKDSFADILSTEAKKDGLDVHFYTEGGEPTGTCAVLVTKAGKARSLVANLAAANTYKNEHLQANWNLVEAARFFYITGFFHTVSPESIQAIGKHCSEAGKTLAMNLSAPFLLQVPIFLERFQAALPFVDVYFGNESEAATLSEVLNWGTTDLKEIALRLAQLPKKSSRPRTVVITQGSEPTYLVVADAERIWFSTECGVIPCNPEDLLDTNGAGDAYVGGFLSGLVKGVSLQECMARANYAANIVVRRSGCTFPEKCTFKFKGFNLTY
eukprot:NODE_973_length_1197_cov_607.103659_g738_i0.p1 GENE.NODE_973_length_1197_cov_607.103659_g738_i0~~NODE_973_length_1197_cov_607.103659_g738_i0.p1  ORF type:complete len:354 (-),score=77.74 NODE_973_length_1197_cov_607.103659_g738_i0:66-1127(-)